MCPMDDFVRDPILFLMATMSTVQDPTTKSKNRDSIDDDDDFVGYTISTMQSLARPYFAMFSVPSGVYVKDE